MITTTAKMNRFDYNESYDNISRSRASSLAWTENSDDYRDDLSGAQTDRNNDDMAMKINSNSPKRHNVRCTTSSSLTLPTKPQNVSVDTVLLIMHHYTDDMVALTQLSAPACILLLSSTRWQPEAAKEAYFIDPAAVLARLHLSFDAAQHTNRIEQIQSDGACCAVCLDAPSSGQTYGLTHCKHSFCKNCWTDQVRYLMKGGGSLLLDMRCLQHGCNELVALPDLLELFDDSITGGNACRAERNIDSHPVCDTDSSMHGPESERDKIRRALAASFVNAFPRLRWCPNARGCTGTVYLPEGYARTQTVVCDVCNLEFCFRCGHQPHEPATCENILNWETMHHSGEISVSVILNSTKKCPHCGMNVLKNGGCNHMTCWQGCMGEFCWVCGQVWSATHKCESAVAENVAAEKSCTAAEKNEVSVRLHKVVTAYMEHLHSDVIESSIFEDCYKNLSDRAVYIKNIPQGQDVLTVFQNTMRDMQRVLHKARLLLAHAYVRGFFLQASLPEARILDCTRWRLQQEAEKLSSHLNDLRDCKSINLIELQTSIKLVNQWTKSNLVS